MDDAVEALLPVNGTELFVREVGAGDPLLVLHGGPEFDCAYLLPEIAAAVPGARLEVLPDCGHFSYAERPVAVREAICSFLHSSMEA